jgi:chromosome segregation ATPase
LNVHQIDYILFEKLKLRILSDVSFPYSEIPSHKYIQQQHFLKKSEIDEIYSMLNNYFQKEGNSVDQIQNLIELNKKLKENLSQLQSENIQLKAQFENGSTQYEILQNERDQIKVQFQTLSDQYQELQDERNQIKIQFQALSDQYQELQNQNIQLKVQLENGSTQYQVLQDENYQIKIQFQTLSTQYQVLQSENQQLNLKINSLENEVTLLHQEIQIPQLKIEVQNLHDPKVLGFKQEEKEKINDFEHLIIIPENTIYAKNISFSQSTLKIIIPKSVSTFGQKCFQNFKNMKTIKIPNSILIIQDWCFGECSSLQRISLSDSVQELQQACFSECSNLLEV